MKIAKHTVVYLVFLFLIAAVISGCQPKISPKRNVLFITIDALRADHLSCYGYRRRTSPIIDTLASQGTFFTQAIVQASYTPPSIASIFTSKYPYQHKVSSPLNSYLKKEFITLAEILKNHNYSTAAITPNFILEPQFGFRQGFDFCSMITPEDKQTDVALGWIKQHKNSPFFAWIHYMSAHAPYTPPSPYNKIFINDSYSARDKESLKMVDDIAGLGGIPRHAAMGDITDKNFYISLYDGAISFADYQVGRLLKGIEELGIADNTLIILSADHGEALGEHEYYFSHGHTLYDSLIKVPLIIKLNNIIPQGKAVKEQVQSIDIAPTILDLLSINKCSGVEGNSLVSLILGKKGHLNEYAFSDVLSKQSVRINGWKLIYNQDKNSYELYNLKEDPDELNNIANFENEKLISLKKVLTKYTKQVKWSKSMGPGPKPLKPALTNETFDKELEERLRSLGYIQ